MLQTSKLYFFVFLLLSVLYIGPLKLGLLSNIVYFYRGIILLVIASIVTASFFYFFYYKKNTTRRVGSVISAVVVVASLHVAFFVTIPVTLDRSVSLFLLTDIERHKQGITKVELEKNFVSEYVNKQDAVGRRVSEQLFSNNIEVTDGLITLTKQGAVFLEVSQHVKRLYGI